MNTIIRSATGYDMEEFYQYSVQYQFISDSSFFINLMNDVIDRGGICCYESMSEYGSPYSFIIDDSFISDRLLITERPVIVDFGKRMEMVLSGNRQSFVRFRNEIYKWLIEANHRGDISLKLDGIFDNLLMPFSVGILFRHSFNNKSIINYIDLDLIYPSDLNYMDLCRESERDRIFALEQFQRSILKRVNGIFRNGKI